MSRVRPGPGHAPRPHGLFRQCPFLLSETLENLRKSMVSRILGVHSLHRNLVGTETDAGAGNVSVAQPESETTLWPNQSRSRNRTVTRSGIGTATRTGPRQVGIGTGIWTSRDWEAAGRLNASRESFSGKMTGKMTIYFRNNDRKNDHLSPEK